MRQRQMIVWMYVAGFLIVQGFSYGLALLGEPRSVWIWRDILGVIQ